MNNPTQSILLRNSEYSRPHPERLPRPWDEMTPSEQAMTIWFARQMPWHNGRDPIARHAIGCAIHANGGTITEEEAQRIWNLFEDAE